METRGAKYPVRLPQSGIHGNNGTGLGAKYQTGSAEESVFIDAGLSASGQLVRALRVGLTEPRVSTGSTAPNFLFQGWFLVKNDEQVEHHTNQSYVGKERQ